MANTYFLLLLLSLIVPIFWTIWKPSKIYEYPYFMVAVMAVFILPQAYSLILFPGGVTSTAIDDVLLMSSLCLWSCFLGYSLKPFRFVVQTFSPRVNFDRFFHIGVVFTIIGLISALTIPRSGIAFATSGGLTGIATIYLFFANLSFPGFAICLLITYYRFTPGRLAITILTAIPPTFSILGGRREPTVVFILTIAMAHFFYKHKSPNRAVLIFGLLFVMLAIPATGTYRALVAEGRLHMVRQVHIVDNFKEFINRESILELRNGAAVISSTKMSGHYAWGSGYWNQMVHRFVPAQLVGKSLKSALLINSSLDDLYSNELLINYDIPTGSTITGMGDAYEQFGWFGCLFFAAIGLLFKSIWIAARDGRSIFAQVFYIMICSSAMRSITHQTVDFIPGVIYHILFLGGAYLYIYEPGRMMLRFTPNRSRPTPRQRRSERT